MGEELLVRDKGMIDRPIGSHKMKQVGKSISAAVGGAGQFGSCPSVGLAGASAPAT
jgi:hypothetical protein